MRWVYARSLEIMVFSTSPMVDQQKFYRWRPEAASIQAKPAYTVGGVPVRGRRRANFE
jgi:hypothetical protein